MMVCFGWMESAIYSPSYAIAEKGALKAHWGVKPANRAMLYTMLQRQYLIVLWADSCRRHHQGAIAKDGMLWMEGIGHLQPELCHSKKKRSKSGVGQERVKS